jgi:hypothetical protein
VIKTGRTRYFRRVDVNLTRAGKQPDVPPEAQAQVGETVLLNTLQIVSPLISGNSTKVFQMSGTLLFCSTQPPPGTMPYPQSVLEAPAPVAASMPKLAGA